MVFGMSSDDSMVVGLGEFLIRGVSEDVEAIVEEDVAVVGSEGRISATLQSGSSIND